MWFFLQEKVANRVSAAEAASIAAATNVEKAVKKFIVPAQINEVRIKWDVMCMYPRLLYYNFDDTK